MQSIVALIVNLISSEQLVIFVNECQYWISCYHESGHLRCIEECDSTIEKARLKDEELRLVKFVRKYEKFI